ncbi:hypothetical protein [Thermococcus waiotapuensis]|uniref:Uncharacterized protein n=1 Tax=Thermococcus waiotapuensis TaxID=90909 RepID=A0AAE4NXS4_9EURY|nr:hypothetical protein [Thermococcus waiotapuensis]MDV3104251.1 hypothetical protein [Thermococcus waiotapuensis]
MVQKKLLQVVLIVGVLLSAAAMYSVAPGDNGGEVFFGVCVKSGGGYSILFNGSRTVLVPSNLEIGAVYRIWGKVEEREGFLRVSGQYRIEKTDEIPPLAVSIEGAYWKKGENAYLLTPDWVDLATPLNIPKGARVVVYGLEYGSKFYPVKYSVLKNASGSFEDGMPVLVKGVVLGYFGAKNEVIVWNGKEKVYVYLPYNHSVGIGKTIELLGRARLTSRVNVYVDSSEDVRVLGYPEAVPINEASTGEIGEGICTVVKSGKSDFTLNCTDLNLRGVRARTGDTLKVKALNTGSHLLCIDCTLVRPREELPNEICNPKEGGFSKIQGKVEWVRLYKNGFGIANVTNGSCWVLLKLPKSLGVSLREGEQVTAYGFFTTYQGRTAFEVASGDDVCSGNC